MAELIHDASTKRPRRWRRAAIALASVCVALVGLVGGQYAHGQQPVVNAAPQPPVLPTPEPETVPPGEAEKMLSLADLEQMALASNPSVARASALVGAAPQ